MKKSWRERQRELREEAILDTAYELLLEQGYQKMNMDDLAARVGVAKMTIYQHFSSKEALAVAVIVRGMKIIQRDLEPLITSSLPALERLEKMFTHSLERRSNIRRINAELTPAMVLQDPAFQLQRQRISEQWIDLIEQAKKEGTVDRSLSTLVLVRLLFLAFQADFDDLVKQETVTREELAHTLISMFIKGMRTDFPSE